jgi:DNA-binding NtrC family response regulator
MARGKVLCVSFDKMVADNRSAIFKEAGYDVTATTLVKNALELLSRDRFDAVIIGHRFSAEERYLLATEAKEKSSTPVVLVCGVSADSEIPAARRVYALEGNAGLLSALPEVIPSEGATRPQVAA